MRLLLASVLLLPISARAASIAFNQYPLATTLNGSEIALVAQNGKSVTVTTGQIAALASGVTSGVTTAQLQAAVSASLISEAAQSVLAPGTGSLVVNDLASTPMLRVGQTTDTFYPPDEVQALSGLAVRTQPYGCYDNGTVGSFIASAAGTSSARSGVTGNCPNGVAGLAAYSSFDEVALYTQASPQAPLLTLSGATYTATDITPASPLTASQLASLHPYEYVLASTGSWGTYIATGSTATDIKIVGWAVRGGANPAAGQVPPAGLSIYFGAPDHVFAKNTVVSMEQPPAVASAATAEEYDVVNNTSIYQSALSGVSILGMGTGGEGTALNIGGTAGYANAFNTDIAIQNFRSVGELIAQTTGNGGVGLDIEMTTGVLENWGNKVNGVAQLGSTGLFSTRGGISVQNPTTGAGVSGLTNDGGFDFLPASLTGFNVQLLASGQLQAVYGTTQEWALAPNGTALFNGPLTANGEITPQVVNGNTLPVNCTPGMEIYVSGGRTPSQAAGAGTGTPAYCNDKSVWIATTTGVAVTD